MKIIHTISYDDSNDRILQAVRQLVQHIEIWAGDVDNIPSRFYPKYVAIKQILSEGGVQHQVKREF